MSSFAGLRQTGQCVVDALEITYLCFNRFALLVCHFLDVRAGCIRSTAKLQMIVNIYFLSDAF